MLFRSLAAVQCALSSPSRQWSATGGVCSAGLARCCSEGLRPTTTAMGNFAGTARRRPCLAAAPLVAVCLRQTRLYASPPLCTGLGERRSCNRPRVFNTIRGRRCWKRRPRRHFFPTAHRAKLQPLLRFATTSKSIAGTSNWFCCIVWFVFCGGDSGHPHLLQRTRNKLLPLSFFATTTTGKSRDHEVVCKQASCSSRNSELEPASGLATTDKIQSWNRHVILLHPSWRSCDR